jgi:hypothetical protein
VISTPEELWNTHENVGNNAHASGEKLVEVHLEFIASALLSIAQSLADINARQARAEGDIA